MDVDTRSLQEPDSGTRTRGRIVVGVDGSSGSIAGLRAAARIADRFDADLDVVSVWSNAITTSPRPLIWSPSESARAIVDDALEQVFGSSVRGGTRALIGEGDPARVLMDHARGADLLVLGGRPHGGIAGLLLGSVAAHCAQHASCPVLIEHEHRGSHSS